MEVEWNTGFRLFARRAVSAFTRVFDALWPGSLGRNDNRGYGNSLRHFNRPDRGEQPLEDVDAGLLDGAEILAVEGRLDEALGKLGGRADDLVEAQSEQAVRFAHRADGVDR